MIIVLLIALLYILNLNIFMYLYSTKCPSIVPLHVAIIVNNEIKIYLVVIQLQFIDNN